MSIFGTSELTDKYVEALIREGDEFDYSKWIRENRLPKAEPKPIDVRVETPPSTSTPLENSTPTRAKAVVNVRAEPKDLSAATGDARVCAEGGVEQRRAITARPTSTLSVQPSAPISTVKPRQVISRSTRAIQAELSVIDKAWKEFQSSRARDAVYGYLEAVFGLVKEWERRGRSDRKARRALRARGLNAAKNPEPYAAVIACTSTADIKARSKWATALQYVASCPPSKKSLREFMKSKGGINGCTSRFARRLGRKS